MLQLFLSTYEGVNASGTPAATLNPKRSLFWIGRVNFKKRDSLPIYFKRHWKINLRR